MLLPYSFIFLPAFTAPMMQLGTYSSPIDISEDALWQLLVDKIENPARYVPESVESEITDRPEEGVWVRRMKTTGPEVVERITTDEQARRVTYTALENPVFDGTITNEIEQREDGEVVLTFRAEGVPKEDPDEVKAQVQGQLRSSVQRLKRIAESKDDALPTQS